MAPGEAWVEGAGLLPSRCATRAATGLQGTELTLVRPRRGLKSQVSEGPWDGSKTTQASEGMGRTHVQWRGLSSQVTLLPSPR